MVSLVRSGWRAAALSLVLLPGLVAGAAPTAAAHNRDHHGPPAAGVVATGLDNPRHIRWSDGALYVAEAGEGGTAPCFDGAEGRACYGATGAITRLKGDRQTRVVTGLPSLGGEGTGAGAIGPSDVRVTGHRFTVALGLGNNPGLRTGQPAGVRRLATVATGRLGSSHLRLVADIGAYEARVNPDGAQVDTNPVALLPRGRSTYVVDAGGNSLLKVGKWGRVSTTAVFPDVALGGTDTTDAVPTAAAYGPDGALYVSQLTGGPFVPGTASIWRVVPGHAPTKYATGLTMVTDLAFDHDGSLYAVQLADQGLVFGPPIGSVVKIPRGGGATHTTVKGGLFLPYGIALHGGAAYVTTHSTEKDLGQVERIPLH